jgi:hypothetical protein
MKNGIMGNRIAEQAVTAFEISDTTGKTREE